MLYVDKQSSCEFLGAIHQRLLLHVQHNDHFSGILPVRPKNAPRLLPNMTRLCLDANLILQWHERPIITKIDDIFNHAVQRKAFEAIFERLPEYNSLKSIALHLSIEDCIDMDISLEYGLSLRLYKHLRSLLESMANLLRYSLVRTYHKSYRPPHLLINLNLVTFTLDTHNGLSRLAGTRNIQPKSH